MNFITHYDTKLFHWLYNKITKQSCVWVKLISKTGDGYLYLILGLALFLFEPNHGKLFLYTSVVAYALELPLFVILKKCFKRQRPCDLIANFSAHVTPSDKFSLPSGHTMAAFLMASLIAHFYPVMTTTVYLWASIVGLSRIMLGVHYPSDVVLGAMLGLTIAILSINLLA